MPHASRRIAILAEGHFAPMEAKTAIGVLRYRPEECVAVLDSRRAGRTAHDCVGAGGDTPVVATLAEAAERGADTLLIGIAPAGGRLPDVWRAAVAYALARGWRVVSGLHTFLGDDPEFAALARMHDGAIEDVRRPPAESRVGLARAAASRALVVLTIGTDCNVGKMTAALELQRELRARGVRTQFVATGQTGIVIAGGGVAVDAVPADFVAGAIERHVLAAAEVADVVLVEGQGTLHHPAFSAVTLGLLHGSCPSALVLCHHHGRTHMRIQSDTRGDGPPLASLAQSREAHERAAAWVHPARVVGVALNTWDTAADAAHAACAAAAATLGVPATDPVRFGAAPVADRIVQELAARSAASTRGPAAESDASTRASSAQNAAPSTERSSRT